MVDVREPWSSSVLIDVSDIMRRREADIPPALPRGRPLVLVCHHGGRSQHAAMLLAGAGFTQVHNLAGGVEAWALDVDSAMKRY